MESMKDDLISRQAAIDDIRTMIPKDVRLDIKWIEMWLKQLPAAQPEQKSCKTCHLWEDGELNIACPWGSNYEHYEDDYCSLWEKQN